MAGTNTATHASEKTPRFVIVGAGMAGILSAIKLQEAGLTDFAIYEKADRVGGTWRENTYPGVGCDVPSHLYSYSFAPNPDWTHLFSPGAEIQAYFEDVARRYGIDDVVQYCKEITRCEFEDGRWQIETADGGRDVADFVIAATGVLHHPAYPDIAGLDSFEGSVFHSARFDHTVALEGKRVGIIGTGSTAVQMLTALADTVGELNLFQRTAQWVLGQENPAYGEQDIEHFHAHPQVLHEMHESLSRTFADHFANAVVDAESPEMKVIERLCLENLENNVTDPDLREKLRPDYRAACKRLVISPNFYEAVQKPNVNLVTAGIEHVEAGGIRTQDGRLHELDVLILATGFRVDRFMRPIDVVGRNGVSLDEVWAKRPSAYLAISVPEFPNLFMLNGPNGPVGNFSLIEVAELQFGYVMQLVDQVLEGKCNEVSATQAATDRFDEDRAEAAKNTVWYTGCRSWYLDDRGVPAAWPWSFDRFREKMAAPELADYDLV